MYVFRFNRYLVKSMPNVSSMVHGEDKQRDKCFMTYTVNCYSYMLFTIDE